MRYLKKFRNARKLFPLILVLLIFLLLRIPFLNFGKFEWDECVYLSNSRFFLGIGKYFEDIRPPLLPIALIPFLSNDLLLRIAPLLFSTLSLISLYFFSEHFFGRKIAIAASLLLAFNPLHIFFSTKIFTEIPSSIFIILTFFFLFEWIEARDEKEKKRNLSLSALFLSLSVLTRYANVIILVPILIILFLERRKLKLKELSLPLLIFFLCIASFLLSYQLITGNVFRSLYYAVYWPSVAPAQPPYYYILNSFQILSSALIFIVLSVYWVLRNKERYESYTLLALLIFFLFFSAFPHKENRYWLTVLPLCCLFGAFSIRLNKNVFYLLLILTPLISIYPIYLKTLEYRCSGEAIVKAGLFLKGKPDGLVLSMFWPEIAYYSNKRVRAFPSDVKDLHDFIRRENVTYIVTSTEYGWPDYAKNQTLFSNFTLLEKFEDNCFHVFVYEV